MIILASKDAHIDAALQLPQTSRSLIILQSVILESRWMRRINLESGTTTSIAADLKKDQA